MQIELLGHYPRSGNGQMSSRADIGWRGQIGKYLEIGALDHYMHEVIAQRPLTLISRIQDSLQVSPCCTILPPTHLNIGPLPTLYVK